MPALSWRRFGGGIADAGKSGVIVDVEFTVVVIRADVTGAAAVMDDVGSSIDRDLRGDQETLLDAHAHGIVHGTEPVVDHVVPEAGVELAPSPRCWLPVLSRSQLNPPRPTRDQFPANGVVNRAGVFHKEVPVAAFDRSSPPL